MSVSLRLATRNYDYVAALANGDIQVPGVDLTLLRDADYQSNVRENPSVDGGELSLCQYLYRRLAGNTEYVGIPIFICRGFRHRNIYVRADDLSLTSAESLRGKRIGIGRDLWDSTTAVWAREILIRSGVGMSDISWVVAHLSPKHREIPAPAYLAPGHPSSSIHIEAPGAGYTLSQMLADETIDAIMSPFPPPGAEEAVRPLYPDTKRAEQDYFSATGIYPPLHILVLRSSKVDQHPDILSGIYTAFERARILAQADRRSLSDAAPWSYFDLAEAVDIMGEDFHGVNGVSANAETLQEFYRTQRAQGLVDQQIDSDLLFGDFVRISGIA